MCRAPSQTHSSKSKHSLLQDLWDKDDCRSFTGGETEVRETSGLTEDSSMSRHQIRTRVKCKGVRALNSRDIGDAGQQCCHSHHYASRQGLRALTKCHLFSQAQEGRRVGKGGTKINDTRFLPIKEREVAWTSWPSLKQACNTFGILEPCSWEPRDRQPNSLGARRRGHLSYDLKEGVDGWRRSEGSFRAEGTVYPGHSSVAYHEGTTDVKWEQRGPASQEPHRGH